jgi:hypothetical protein
MGTPLLVISVAGLVVLPFRHGKAGWLLVVAAAVLYAVIGYPRDHFMRYTIPLLPPLALSGAAVLSALGARAPALRRVSAGVAGLLVLWALVLTAAQLAFLVGPAVHDRAADWIRGNLPRGRQVAFAGSPWFYTPPITRFQCGRASARLLALSGAKEPYRFAVLDWDHRELLRRRAPCLVMADVEAMARGAADARETGRFLGAVKRAYRPWRSFPERGVRRVVANALDKAPPDWRYPSPVITVYRLREQGTGR